MKRLALGLMVWAGMAAAEAPETSPRPQGRPTVAATTAAEPAIATAVAPTPAAAPETAAATASTANAAWYFVDVSALAPERSVRPSMRARVAPEAATDPVTGGEARAEWYNVSISSLAPALSPRPAQRTPGVVARAARLSEERTRGAVCGDLDIQGTAIGTIDGPGRCGVRDAVRLRSVAGVRLSVPTEVNCRTARALKDWVERGLLPTVGSEGGGAVEMRVLAGYSCRTRNSVPGARLSEHSFGNAIDIGGIRLANGSEMSVLRGWNRDEDGGQLRQMHRAACGIFGTVLGPNANAAHRDHFHFDVASYRSGSYCR